MVVKDSNRAKKPQQVEPQPPQNPQSERENRLQVAVRREQLSHSQGGPIRSTSYAPEPPKATHDSQGIPKTEKELEKEELKKLTGKSKGEARLKSGCGDDDGCGQKIKEINLEALAELVFERMIFEVRIERERTGWTV